jgi:HPt (histidine-containing phosphotransfer) domain-containing protein
MDIPTQAEEFGMDEEDVRRLYLTFLESTEQDLILLDQAFTEQDAEKLRATAHQIKGAAGNLELEVIAEAARRIEEKARCGIIEDPAAHIAHIRTRLELIRTQLLSEQ